MARIESFEFGSIVIGGKRYRHDVLILPDGIVRRRRAGLWKTSSHVIKGGEIDELVKAKPEVVVVGTGAGGETYVAPDAKLCATEAKIKLTALPTPEAVETYNQLVGEGKLVSAIIHITC